jgi:hypothetical protein
MRIVYKCKTCLKKWLNDENVTARRGKSINDYVKPARNCLYILQAVAILNDIELTTLCVRIVSQFGHRIYFGSYSPNTINGKELKERISDKGKCTTVKEIISECTEVFKRLPADVKYNVLAQRLTFYNDNDFKVATSVEFGSSFLPSRTLFSPRSRYRHRSRFFDSSSCSRSSSRSRSRSGSRS